MATFASTHDKFPLKGEMGEAIARLFLYASAIERPDSHNGHG